MTEDEINQLMADVANETMAAIGGLTKEIQPAAAYGAGLASAILMRKLRELARETEKH